MNNQAWIVVRDLYRPRPGFPSPAGLASLAALSLFGSTLTAPRAASLSRLTFRSSVATPVATNDCSVGSPRPTLAGSPCPTFDYASRVLIAPDSHRPPWNCRPHGSGDATRREGLPPRHPLGVFCSVRSPRPTLVGVPCPTDLVLSGRREAPLGSELARREAASLINCRPHGSGDATNLELGPGARSVVTPVTTNQHGVPKVASFSLRSYSPGLAPRARPISSVATPVATITSAETRTVMDRRGLL